MKNNLSNKIQLDRLKSICECTFFVGSSGKKYLTKKCNKCKKEERHKNFLNSNTKIETVNIAGVNVEEFKIPTSDLSDHYLDILRMNQPISNLDYFKK
jgi:hypothetical protein